MRKMVRVLAVLPLFAFVAVGMLVTPATAQDKGKDARAAPAAKGDKGKAERKVIAENEKMIVFEVRQRPGEMNTPNTSVTRAVRALQGGTISRTYADGKTETKVWRTGEVEIQVPGPAYTTKNTGKTDFAVYVVVLKEAPQPAATKK